MDASEQETPRIWEERPVSESSMSSKKKKSKRARNARRAAPTELSTSTPGQKEAVLQEALAGIELEKAEGERKEAEV